MKKPISLTIVASSQDAKFFEKTGAQNSDYRLIREITAELDSEHEKPGRTFSSTGSVRHAIEPHTDRRQVEKHHFAEKISENLLELEKSGQYEEFSLIASHAIMAELDKTLSNQLKQKITHKLAKDIVGFSNQDIKEYLVKKL